MRALWQRLPFSGQLSAVVWAALFSTSLGCEEARARSSCAEPGQRVVAAFDGWLSVGADEDPFWLGYEGDPVVCAADSQGPEQGVEGSWWEIETVTCGYLTLEQPSAVSLCAGDEIVLRLWHFNLLDTGADFRVALALAGDAPLLDARIAVPASAELLELRATLSRGIPAGELLRFHLSNHGTNSWGLMDIVVE